MIYFQGIGGQGDTQTNLLAKALIQTLAKTQTKHRITDNALTRHTNTIGVAN